MPVLSDCRSRDRGTKNPRLRTDASLPVSITGTYSRAGDLLGPRTTIEALFRRRGRHRELLVIASKGFLLGHDVFSMMIQLLAP